MLSWTWYLLKVVRNKKFLVLGIIQISISLSEFAMYIWADKPTYLFFAFELAVAGIVILISSVSPCFLGEKQAESFEDERDIHIASKCSLIASRIMFYCVTFATLVFWFLYHIFEKTLFIWLSVSLFSCLLLFAVVYLIANIYYEKRG